MIERKIGINIGVPEVARISSQTSMRMRIYSADRGDIILGRDVWGFMMSIASFAEIGADVDWLRKLQDFKE